MPTLMDVPVICPHCGAEYIINDVDETKDEHFRCDNCGKKTSVEEGNRLASA